MKYTIKNYTDSDKERFRSFINKYWRKNHIIATSDIVFDFQHKLEDHYTFLLAENQDTKEIDGVFGYILTHKYDTSHQIPNTGWGAIWKTREDVSCPGLGMALLKHMMRNEPIVSFVGSGTSPMVDKLYDILHYTKGTLLHYYIANPNILEFHIAEEPICKIAQPNVHVYLKQISLQDAAKLSNTLNPYKNVCYYQHRYADHPIYRYRFYGLYHDDELQQIFVVRKQRMEQYCCLRIVDMMGTTNAYDATSAWQELLHQENAEYVDCWNSGLETSFFETLGFTKVSGKTIIPDYFCPFYKRNITINTVCSNTALEMIIFKGDDDQDRPNSETIEEW